MKIHIVGYNQELGVTAKLGTRLRGLTSLSAQTLHGKSGINMLKRIF